MESIKVIIEPYLQDTTDFTFIYESDATGNVEKFITAHEIGTEIFYHAEGNKKVTDTEKGIINAIIKYK